MIPPGARVGIAVSGGADSVALLRALAALAASRDFTALVFHMDHDLRGAESEADARFVAALAAELGLFCKINKSPLPAQGNLEQEARDARYQWLRECTIMHNLDRVALGHTRSDQAETVLFRLLRGSAGAGLAAMRPITAGLWIRPLLDLTRADTRAYLHNLAHPWREDSSNLDLSFDRNRLRLELLPNLAQSWNPAIERTLSHTAEWARAEEDYWAAIIAPLAERLLQPLDENAVAVEAAALATLPLAAGRRLVRHAIERVRGSLRDIGFAHVEQILALAAPSLGSARIQIPGLDAMRSFEWIRLAPPDSYSGARDFRLPVSIPSETRLPESHSTLGLQVDHEDYRYNGEVVCLDRDRVEAPFTLRTWLPGDRYTPVGALAPLKLKSLFQQHRVPLWERRTWPVLVAGPDEAIVWTRYFGPAAGCAASATTRSALHVVERPSPYFRPASALLESEPDIRRL